MLRYTLTFTGRVQGVGFRATAVEVAAAHAVSGWVRNERDGSVRCVVEGQPDDLDRFVAELQRMMAGYIAQTDLESAPATGEFQDFSIARW